MNEVYKLLNEKEFINSLFGFAYKRTNNSYEAEDLCSDIILSVISSARKNSDITNPYAFIWTIARRVYADFSEKRKNLAMTNIEYSGKVFPIDEYIEDENDTFQLRRILREIMFLSKIYRDVCVMYYLDELKISDIAKRLDITESAVKHRLYSARKTIKKGVEKMESLTLKPIGMAFIGTGNPVGNDPSDNAHRLISKSILYLCKNTERSIKELSQLLGVPMPFIEEEVYFQVKGKNGYYGLLRETDSGKYISNFIIVDYDDYMKVSKMYKKNTDIIAERFDAYIKKNEQKILDMPFLNKQTDISLIAWGLIYRVNWWFIDNIEKRLAEKYFSDIQQTKRDFFTFGIANREGDAVYIGFYGCDGFTNYDCYGYKEIYMSNLYGRRLNKHFSCEHNISTDPCLRLTIKAINGLPLSSLSEAEQETAAKAIEVGYLKKENDNLYPKILVSESEDVYIRLINKFISETDDLIEPVVDEIYGFIKKFVPKHLIGEYKMFVQMTSCGLLDGMIEKCIELKTLVPPENKLSAEGVIMVLKK